MVWVRYLKVSMIPKAWGIECAALQHSVPAIGDILHLVEHCSLHLKALVGAANHLNLLIHYVFL